tara:strand:- start:306 stop:500 length:195 start_codon:yes stop_codon:yes gene_type:complete
MIKLFNLKEQADKTYPGKPIWMKYTVSCMDSSEVTYCIPDILYYNVETEIWNCGWFEVKQNYIT